MNLGGGCRLYSDHFEIGPGRHVGNVGQSDMGPVIPCSELSVVTSVEALMHYCVVVRAQGKELDYLRGAAYRVSRDAKTDWYAEPRDLGTAFCFEDPNVQT